MHEFFEVKAAPLWTTKEQDLAAWEATLRQQGAAFERKKDRFDGKLKVTGKN